MKKSIKFHFIIKMLFIAILLLSGCKSAPQVSPLASPLLSPVSGEKNITIEPEITPIKTLPVFALDGPLYEGDTRVTGTGPAKVPITIMDISYMTEIGKGKIDARGNFSIKVSPALVEYSLIGIMLDETQASPYTKEDLVCGDNCRDQPLVGTLYDVAPVTKQ